MISAKLEEAIKASNLTKKQVCLKSKISRQTLDNILNGSDMRISNLKALAKTLNVKMSYFFENEPPTNNNNTAVLIKQIVSLQLSLEDKEAQLRQEKEKSAKYWAMLEKLTQ